MSGDSYPHMQRFVEAQNPVFERVLAELQSGRKQSHWMWFVFPQLQGLGRSSMARYFALASQEEACVYARHPVLGKRLVRCCELLLEHKHHSAEDIFGAVDAIKLRSSMTLFLNSAVSGPSRQVLDHYYAGNPDPLTLQLLQQHGG